MSDLTLVPRPLTRERFAPYGDVIEAGPAVTSAMGGLVGQVMPPTTPSWQGRSIATHKFRLLEFSAYVDQQRDAESLNKHLFVHIGPVAYADPLEVLYYKLLLVNDRD